MKIGGLKITPQGQLPSCQASIVTKKMSGRQILSEYVSNLLFSRKVLQAKNTIMDQLSNEVQVNLNVLCIFMLNWVVKDVYVTLIITPKSSGMILWNVELCQQMLKPNEFFISKNNRMIPQKILRARFSPWANFGPFFQQKIRKFPFFSKLFCPNFKG